MSQLFLFFSTWGSFSSQNTSKFQVLQFFIKFSATQKNFFFEKTLFSFKEIDLKNEIKIEFRLQICRSQGPPVFPPSHTVEKNIIFFMNMIFSKETKPPYYGGLSNPYVTQHLELFEISLNNSIKSAFGGSPEGSVFDASHMRRPLNMSKSPQAKMKF